MSVAMTVAVVMYGASAAGAGDYAQDLAHIYGAHQRVLALKDACSTALPGQRATNEKAYANWKQRNQRAIAEVEQRFAALIRGASKDEKDLAKNVGKYEGAILKQRQEDMKAFLAQPKPEVQRLCKEFPDSLKNTDTDLEKAYADEFADIRKHP